jgi:phospholipase C
VPAIVISPLILKNVIDHRLYDHASIPATIESFFEVDALTERDAKANRLDALLSLNAPRTDTPTTLPSPATSQAQPAVVMKMMVPDLSATVAARPNETVDQGTLPVILHSALRQDLEISPEQRTVILERVRSIKTREQARQYLAEVQKKIRQRRAAAQAAPGWT